MAIDKLPEFAKDGQKNTDDLVLTDGFPVLKKPARQWFNWLFNTVSLKINEIIDNKIDFENIVDNLTTDDATKPLSAAQGKVLQDSKLGKTSNLSDLADLQTALTNLGFQQNLTNYQRLPSGLIIQFGSLQHTNSGGQTIPFPITFPNSCRAVIATDISSANSNIYTMGVADISASNFKIYATSYLGGASSAALFNWVAIGY